MGHGFPFKKKRIFEHFPPVPSGSAYETDYMGIDVLHREKTLAGLETQPQNAAFFERKRPKRKPWHRGKSLNRKKDRNAFFER